MINMKLISHRGNISGKNNKMENTTPYIIGAITMGFDVEIDIRVVNDKIYLGHDAADYEIELKLLMELKDHLWVHCKNILALSVLRKDFNCFFHDKDDVTLTSHGYLWTYPGKQLENNSICVLPEINIDPYNEYKNGKCVGICSDFIKEFSK